ncbi:MAG: hypothetical protein ABIN94_08590 [Ferruginibacter sp.]
MKKLIVLLITASFFSALNAQPHMQQSRVQRNKGNKNYEVTYNHNNNSYPNDVAYTNNHRSNEYTHEQSNESINRNYSQRMGAYKNNRRPNSHEQYGRVYEIERERQKKAPSFGKGLAVGAIAGIILGVIVSR